MSSLNRHSLVLIIFGLFLLVLTPAGLAQEEAPPETTAPAEEPAVVVDIPEPAVEIVRAEPAEVQQAWTFRYLIPTSLVIALLVVVGSIVAYFLKVVRSRYRLIQ
jgi:hypothetical protein